MRRLINPTSVVFVAIILVIAVWIGRGMLFREQVQAPEPEDERVPRVAASWSEAEDITLELVLYGDVEPVQVTILRARVDGIIEEIAAQGSHVSRGDRVGRVSADDRTARLARAEAQVASASRDYDAARGLADRDIGTEAEAQARRAELEAARAELQTIELEIANTELTAPIDGVINEVITDIGSYVSVGGEVLEVVDNARLIASVQVQQTAIQGIRTGMPALVRFIGGGAQEGEVRFVSAVADAATRTFRVEVEMDNSDGALPSGLSAEVVLPFETVSAHRVSPALGRLDEQGRLGVHVVDDDDRIAFLPVEVVRARGDGVWITGLADRARIVTISQGSLAPGQRVTVTETPPEYLGDIPDNDAAPAEVPHEPEAGSENAAPAEDD
ncbi:efflux RND transporter periplasmic adaptor subunit [Roseinatronobacter sp. S2]|uniref:efflux RND transporter periplasmic adaptor subunit n=1 Tax=Roseinatronobacter sp. S2 TaxID=3035471 RepID=UPI00240FD526|nr:efflux RND transporter periplasmic adaptor subunit [Roseinatronobacter sp. S2]WFE76596.1 efflux RND transporter periplasmic adaptor subunit [Roseinatronobacter sp. S2]